MSSIFNSTIDFNFISELLESVSNKNLNYIFFFPLSKLIIFPVYIVCLLLAIAFYTLMERKVMSSMQRRLGPNVTGF